MGVQYEVNLAGVRSVISQQQNLSTQIGMVNVSVLQAQTMLRLTMSAAVRGSIDAKLKKIRRDLEAESQSARKMNRTLQEVVDFYNLAEQQALDAQKDLSASGDNHSVLPQWLLDFCQQVSEFFDENNSVKDAFDFAAGILKGAGKTVKSDEAGLAGKILGLFSSISEIINSTPQELFGNVVGYISDSFGILSKFSEVLANSAEHVVEEMGLSKFGAVTGVIGSVTGLVEDLIGTAERWNSTTGDPTDRKALTTEKAIDSLGSLAEVIVSGKGLKDVMKAIGQGSIEKVGDAQKAFKTCKSWLTLVDTVVSSVSSGAKTAVELGADGRISAQDVGEIFFTGGVHGLDTLVSGVTFGLVSSETLFGKSVDECIDATKSWASDLVTNTNNYIRQNPQWMEEYNQAGPFKQTAMYIGAIFTGNRAENRTVTPGHNVEATEGIWMKIAGELSKGYPGMQPIALPIG